MPVTLQLGKRPGWTLAATGVTGLTSSRLFFVSDTHTHTHFLVDTGSEVSAIPPTPGDRTRPPDTLALTVVNNSSIHTYGQRSLTLNLGLRRSLPWIFVIADVQKPILGADFLQHYGLTVDMHKHKLIDTHTRLQVQGILSSGTSPRTSLCPKDLSNPYLALLSEFPTRTQVTSPDTPVGHDINHHIETTGPSASARPRRLAPDHLKVAKRDFEHMLQHGIICPSSSACLSTWSQKRPPETGVRVAITVPSTGTHARQVPRASPSRFRYLTTGCHCILQAGPGSCIPPDSSGPRGHFQDSRHHPIRSSSRCPLDFTMLLRHSSVSWTKSSSVSLLHTHTSTTSSSQVPPQHNTSMT